MAWFCGEAGVQSERARVAFGQIGSVVRQWACPSCGTSDIDWGINVALNICDKGILELKAAGLAVTTCGGLRKPRHERVAASETRSLAR